MLCLIPNSFCWPWVLWFLSLGNHSQVSRVPVAIKVLDVNDNAPEFASEHEAFLCENGKPGQVSIPAYMWCEAGLEFLLPPYVSFVPKMGVHVFIITGLSIKINPQLNSVGCLSIIKLFSPLKYSFRLKVSNLGQYPGKILNVFKLPL